MNLKIPVLVCTLFSILRSVSTLRCYQCSNIYDVRCGLEWKFEGAEADNYLTECHVTATSCNKIVSERQGNGQQYIYRKCWNQTTIENYTPSGCKDQYITGIIICHCSRDGCNGSDVMHATWKQVFTFFLSTMMIITIR